jgi:hypothetical protein
MKNPASVDIDGVGRSKPKPSSILGPLCKAFGPTFILGSFFKLIQDLLGFVSPQILKYVYIKFK